MAGRHSEVEKWMKAFSHMTWVPFTAAFIYRIHTSVDGHYADDEILDRRCPTATEKTNHSQKCLKPTRVSDQASAKKRRGVFGQTLENTILYERRHGERLAPWIVEQCVNFIRSCGLHEVGLFHQPGQARLVRELQEAFDAGEKLTFDSNTDVHTVASLLKLYLQKLPEPVVPFSKYADLLVCANLMTEDKEKGIVELKKQLTDLPSINLNLLVYICRFLDEVQSHSTVNKMDVQNLASVFGPNILRPKLQEPEEGNGGSALVNQLMSVLICEHTTLFPSEEGSHAASRTDGAWQGAAEDPGWAAARAKSLSLPLAGAGRNSWTAVRERAARSPSHSAGHNKSKRRATPPGELALNVYDNYCTGNAPRAGAPTHEESGAVTGYSPQANGPFPAIQRLSASCSRAEKLGIPEGDTGSPTQQDCKFSIYDNIYFAPLARRADAHAAAERDSWTSSPGETIVLEEGSSSRFSSRTSCTEAAMEEHMSTPVYVGRLENAAFCTVSSSNSNNSEVFLSSSDVTAGQHTLQCLVAGLKHQISTQKADYEAKVKSLEKQNDELETEIKDLHLNLDQQKKWYDIGEIKMRNAERARRDAERRNEMLQKEMEQFFNTFGELTGEVKKNDQFMKNL